MSVPCSRQLQKTWGSDGMSCVNLKAISSIQYNYFCLKLGEKVNLC